MWVTKKHYGALPGPRSGTSTPAAHVVPLEKAVQHVASVCVKPTQD